MLSWSRKSQTKGSILTTRPKRPDMPGPVTTTMKPIHTSTVFDQVKCDFINECSHFTLYTFVNVFYSYNYFFSFKNCVTYKTNSIEQCYIQLLTCQTPVKDWDKKFFNRNVTVKVRQFCVIQYWWDTNIEQPPRGSNKIQLSKKGPFRSMFRRF